MKKGIIFDLDGTLWDSSDKVVPAWNIILKRNGQDLITVEDMQGYMGKTIEMIGEIMLPKLSIEQRMRIMKECCAEEVAYLKQEGGILYPKLEEVLEVLNKEYDLFIVSNCQDGYIECFLEYHKLNNYFKDIECSGRTGKNKGENIKLIIERNKLEKSVYVGDTQGDLDASDYVNVPFIYAKYGFGKVNRDVVSIDKIEELLEKVEKIF